MTSPHFMGRIQMLLAITFALALVIAAPAHAQDDTPQPQTTADPNIPVPQLQILVKPLTRDELTVEADAWQELLKAKVRQISEARVADEKIKETANAQAEADAESDADETAQAQSEAQAEALEEQRTKQIERINELRSERSALIERVNVVLAELTLKGGDVEAYDQYVKAVSDPAITVDVQDVNATWVAIRAWATSADGGVRWLTNIVMFFVTLIVFCILAIIASRAAGRLVRSSKKASSLLKDFVVGIVRKTVLAIGFILALTYLEVDISPLLAAIGGAAFVIAFALQGTLSNFAAGILILAYRPFDVGDVIDTAGVSGVVDSMSLVSTTIKSFDNKKIIVPNGSIWGDVITNATAMDTRRIDMTFGISYSDDIDKAQKILEEIVTSHELVLKDPAPTIKMHELADSSVNFVVRPWSKTSDYWAIYWDVQKAVKQRFDAEGISIPFPQRDVHVHQVPAAGGA